MGTILHLNAWRSEITHCGIFFNLKEWATSEPSMKNIMEIADILTQNYVEDDRLNMFEMQC